MILAIKLFFLQLMVYRGFAGDFHRTDKVVSSFASNQKIISIGRFSNQSLFVADTNNATIVLNLSGLVL